MIQVGMHPIRIIKTILCGSLTDYVHDLGPKGSDNCQHRPEVDKDVEVRGGS